ncbi:hypothetical protein FRC02_006945 [Tulasnella sp. 418]|nr:hypothetical protein FRC02_006945 [Tulasnella sp. 418]
MPKSPTPDTDSTAVDSDGDRKRASSSSASSSSDSLSLDSPRPSRGGSPTSLSSITSTSTVSSDRLDSFFRTVCGRQLNTMNTTYFLPSDEAEIKRMDQEHRMLRFILGGKSYVGPVGEVLASSKFPDRRVLDCGTGSGQWCIELAEEFPKTQVIGVDLAPIQPREVPPNCSFELFDLDGQQLPFPDSFFDVIHCRSIYMGIRNYPLFLRECARVLRKNGLIILAEADSTPMTDNKRPMAYSEAPGWSTLWEEYRRGLYKLGVDVTIPTRLRSMLQEIPSLKDNVVAQEALVPIDPLLLTIGQLSWMNQDNLIPSVIPQLCAVNGLSEKEAKKLVENAQKELYYPNVRPYSCWHIAHARKSNNVR